MRIRNPDGGEAGACGNATRCVVRLLHEETGNRLQVIQTISGLLPAEVLPDGRVQVDMGPARLDWQDIPLAHAADTLHLDLSVGPVRDPAAASMGNPHATFFVDDVACIGRRAARPGAGTRRPVSRAGQYRLRTDPGARPHPPAGLGTSAGLTLACGSGACATLVNAARRGLTGRHATIVVDGGELEIAWREDGHVLMTGPTAIAFRGTIDLDRYAA